jgi:hypothetical protein
MATPKEISERIDGLFSEWSGGFTALSFAVLDMRREMYIRIFGTGKAGGTNSAGAALPTKPYTPAYAKLKAKNGRPPLELTGFLKRSFATDQTSVFAQGFGVAIYIQGDEVGKVNGLEKLYGPIFQPTDEEQTRMLQLHADLLVEQISNQISKP